MASDKPVPDPKAMLVQPAQPHVMTVAGTDSSGGAGVGADVKTISALGCYGSMVLTAATAQNTLGVQGVHAIPPSFVISQLQSVFDDVPPAAVKFGMLAGADTVEELARFFSALKTLTPQAPYLVLDPVMVSTSGHDLLQSSATKVLREQLIPIVDLLTPNIKEAVVIADRTESIDNLTDMIALAKELAKSGPAVLLKGGHLELSARDVKRTKVDPDTKVYHLRPEIRVCQDYVSSLQLPEATDVVVDVLADSEGVRLFIAPKIESSSTHGTGCTLSAALAANYAKQVANEAKEGKTDDKEKKQQSSRKISDETVFESIAYVQGAIAAAVPMGAGHGPLNHGHLSMQRPLPPPTEANPTPFTDYLIRYCGPLWQDYVTHPFVQQLGNGTLPLESFKHYIVQDWHYLRHYARVHGLGAYKANDFDTIQAFAEIAGHIARESEMHIEYCQTFGITRAELEATPDSGACSAYARYMLDVSNQGTVLDTYVSVLSCLIGYGEVGLWLKSRVETGEAKLEGNPYRRWMEDYAGEEFIGACRRGIANLEKRIAEDPPSPMRLEQLAGIFKECVRLEKDFWQMGLDLAM